MKTRSGTAVRSPGNRIIACILTGLLLGFYGLLAFGHASSISLILWASVFTCVSGFAWHLLTKRYGPDSRFRPDAPIVAMLFLINLSSVRLANEIGLKRIRHRSIVLEKCQGGGRYKRYHIRIAAISENIAVTEAVWKEARSGDSISYECGTGALNIKMYNIIQFHERQ